MMKRAAISTAAVGAAAASRAPTVKVIAAAMMSRRRPSRSARGPATMEPTMAPRRSTATTAPCMNGESPKSDLMKRMAPEMTPVS